MPVLSYFGGVRERVAVRSRLARVDMKVAGSLLARAPGNWQSVTGVSGHCTVLTFDDGPTDGVTEAILGVLAEYDAHATFFMLTCRARSRPDLVCAVRDAGHEVALHGPDHRLCTDFGRRATLQRLGTAKAELEDLAQAPIEHFRPPYGVQSLLNVQAVAKLGMRSVLWGPTFMDWLDVPQARRVEAATSLAKDDGVVVLAHDGFAAVTDGVDDGPEPLVDRVDLLRTVLTLWGEVGRTATSLAAARALGHEPVLESRVVSIGVKSPGR